MSVQRRLVAGIAVDGGREATGDTDGVVQNLGHRRQAVVWCSWRSETTISSLVSVLSFTPKTMVLSASLAGAEISTPLGAGRQMRLDLFLG